MYLRHKLKVTIKIFDDTELVLFCYSLAGRQLVFVLIEDEVFLLDVLYFVSDGWEHYVVLELVYLFLSLDGIGGERCGGGIVPHFDVFFVSLFEVFEN